MFVGQARCELAWLADKAEQVAPQCLERRASLAWAKARNSVVHIGAKSAA